jgi:hypothetical protein
MISNVHIVRKALICVSLWIALTVELTIFGAATFAQNYAPGLLPPPSAGSAGSATVLSDSATPIPPNLPSEAVRFDPDGDHCGTQRLQYDDAAEPASQKPASRPSRGSPRLCWRYPSMVGGRSRSTSMSDWQIAKARWSISGTSAMARYRRCKPAYTCSTFTSSPGLICAHSV